MTVNTTTHTVSVNAAATSSGVFSAIAGISSTSQSAGAKAGSTTGSTSTCTGSSEQCDAVYAGNTACPSTNSPGASQSPVSGFQDGNTGGGATPIVNGTVHSEGGITIENSGPSFNGSPPITVAGSCYTAGNMPDYNKATEVASQPWPINYAASPYFSACTTTCTTVSGIANVPPYCTQATTSSTGFNFTNVNNNPELPVSGNVYCSIGTGTASNPATWNGPIQIQANDPASGCGSSYPQVTFISGNISFITDNGSGTSICLSPDLDNCLMYWTDNINIYNGTFDWTGNISIPAAQSSSDLRAPAVTATARQRNARGLERLADQRDAGPHGDGPAGSSWGGNSGSSDSLLG